MASRWPARSATAWRSRPEATSLEQRRATAEQGNGEAVGDGADLGHEAGIGSQRLCFLGQKAGHGEPWIALRRHGSR